MSKVLNPGRTVDGQVYIKVVLKKEEINHVSKAVLSITGVVGPKANGDCRGSCGQCQDSLLDIVKYNDGWDQRKVWDLFTIWERWHLNDMRGGCVHQVSLQWNEARKIPSRPWTQENSLMWSDTEHGGFLSHPCPICGHKYGSSWEFEEIPEWVLDYLEKMPETKIKPAWV